jgi:hypothetical protein
MVSLGSCRYTSAANAPIRAQRAPRRSRTAVTGANHAEGAGSSIELLLRWIGLLIVSRVGGALVGTTGVGPGDDFYPPLVGRLLISLSQSQVTGDIGHLPAICVTHGHMTSMALGRTCTGPIRMRA